MHVQSVQKYCFSLSNMQICGGFVAVIVIPSLAPREEHIACAYQTWKPQFLSVRSTTAIRRSLRQRFLK